MPENKADQPNEFNVRRTPFARNPTFELFYVSFVMLFLELVLIRWIGSEVRIYAHLKNFVLIACFLGIGIGCFQSKSKFKPLSSLIVLVLMIFCISEPYGLTLFPFKQIAFFAGEAFYQGVNLWDKAPEDGSLFTRLQYMFATVSLTVILFMMITYIFNPLGRKLGYLFDHHPRIIQAYSVNVIGSLAGSLAFVLMSYLETPPWAWFAVFLVMIVVYFCSPKAIVVWALSLTAVVAMLWQSDMAQGKTFWSPYQKLVMTPYRFEDETLFAYQIDVNNAGYQGLINLSYDFIASKPEYMSATQARFGHYELPYHLAGNPQSVLIVGGGGGNDAASAIRHGVKEIDCVEIDPTIIKIGKLYHPERPYDDDRVNIINDDARAFFQRTTKRYDLIWFGLADSHTSTSGYTNVRLDNFLYTKESLRKAKKLLKEDGVLILSYEVAFTDNVSRRLYSLLTETFEKEPLSFHLRTDHNRYGFGGDFFVAGNRDPGESLKVLPEDIRGFIEENRVNQTPGMRLTTDNWPFLYLPKPAIPPLYILISLAIILCFLAIRRYHWKEAMPVDWKFLFLGAGFMLLEVQSVTKAGLLFGSTWIVSSFIISQILMWILAANVVYARWKPKSITPCYVGILACIMMLYFVPMRVFFALNIIPRLIFSSLFLTLPIFLAGIIFIHLFGNAEKKNEALGSNLFGALIGGLLESLSLAIGFKALLIPTAIFYLLALAASRSLRVRGT